MDARLIQWLASVKGDPLAFVLGAFPWGEPGTVLEKFDGPMPWARELMADIKAGLLDLNTAIQLATASGHGIAKSATVAHLILWGFTTSPDCRGVITANTETQLKTKTWAEVGKWFNLCWFARDHFQLNATSLLSRDPTRERTWRIDMIPWSATNPAAFAGLHNQGKRLMLIMDEASEIPDIIWETAEGAMTDADTEILWLAFGNPTRNSGRFRECFEGGRHHEFWKCRQIDSRTVPITNKARFEGWIRAYGEDSDFVRIRVLGQFPRVGEMEFFSSTEVEEAMKRDVYVAKDDPLSVGVDVARFGANNSVIWPRKGRDARTFPRQAYNGLDTYSLAQKVFGVFNTYRPDAIFIDGGGVGGGVVDNVRRMQLACIEVQFGGKDDITGIVVDNFGERYSNKRGAMYGALRAWTRTGALPDDPILKRTMLAIRYTFNGKDQIQLVSKEDLIDDNPGAELDFDSLDALALTFGGPIAPNAYAGGVHDRKPEVEYEYNPFSEDRMNAA